MVFLARSAKGPLTECSFNWIINSGPLHARYQHTASPLSLSLSTEMSLHVHILKENSVTDSFITQVIQLSIEKQLHHKK